MPSNIPHGAHPFCHVWHSIPIIMCIRSIAWALVCVCVCDDVCMVVWCIHSQSRKLKLHAPGNNWVNCIRGRPFDSQKVMLAWIECCLGCVERGQIAIVVPDITWAIYYTCANANRTKTAVGGRALCSKVNSVDCAGGVCVWMWLTQTVNGLRELWRPWCPWCGHHCVCLLDLQYTQCIGHI